MNELINWCEDRYIQRYNRLKVLRSPDQKHALFLNDGRIAVVADDNPPDNGFNGLKFALVRNNDRPQWFVRSEHNWSICGEEAALKFLHADGVDLDEDVRKFVVQTINHDHIQQLRSSSIARSMVEELDIRFSEPYLYIFELLQNAVDEGAKRLSFEIRDESLIFQHDGKPFNASDVLGLSAIGASGKSGRTIGFMGLGFKSVYIHFNRVMVCDGKWSFRYERPDNITDGKWKILPVWCDDAIPPQNGFCCRFNFSRLEGENNKLADHMIELKDVVPVILARRSLQTKESDMWELNWNGRIMQIKQESGTSSNIEYFHLMGSERRWFFISTRWLPSEDAIKSWRVFRKDKYGDPGEQELILFAELDKNGNLLNTQTSGEFYAVLPTGEKLPFGFDLQANWLLNTERTALQRGHAWNKEIISHLPDLIVRLLQWVASGEGPSEIQEVYRRLPTFKMTPHGRLVLIMLKDIEGRGIEVDFSSVVDELRKSPLIPVLSSPEPQPENLPSSVPPENEQNTSSEPTKNDRLVARRWVVRPDQCTYQFVRVDECRCVPDAFLADLSPQFIRRWLGKPPFAFSTTEPAGEFFRSMGILGKPSDKEWLLATANYQLILQPLPENVRAWVAIHVIAATLRSESQIYAPSIPLSILPNGHWKLCAISDLKPGTYHYYLQLNQDVREILVLDPQKTPALALMLALMRIPERSNEKHHVDANAVINMFWPNGKGQLLDIRDITEPFFKNLAKDNPEDLTHRVVTVTTALRKLSGANAVTHVLAKKGGQLQLLPKDEVWVGADYGFPYIERAAAGEIPIVAPDYGDANTWKAFFISECQTTPLRWKIINQICGFANIKQYIKGDQPKKPKAKKEEDTIVSLPLNLEKTWTDTINNLKYFHIFGTTIDPWDEVLKNGKFDHARARAFAELLAQGNYSEIKIKKPKEDDYKLLPTQTYVTWIATETKRDYEPRNPIQCPNWIELLRNKAWVPTNNGGVALPKDVLFKFDPDNPDAPFADLDDATRKGLEPLREAVNFGKDVPQYGPLDKLINAAMHPETSNQRMVDLWGFVA